MAIVKLTIELDTDGDAFTLECITNMLSKLQTGTTDRKTGPDVNSPEFLKAQGAIIAVNDGIPNTEPEKKTRKPRTAKQKEDVGDLPPGTSIGGPVVPLPIQMQEEVFIPGMDFGASNETAIANAEPFPGAAIVHESLNYLQTTGTPATFAQPFPSASVPVSGQPIQEPVTAGNEAVPVEKLNANQQWVNDMIVKKVSDKPECRPAILALFTETWRKPLKDFSGEELRLLVDQLNRI